MLIKLILASLKQLFRNKQALFWSLVFPLLFAFIFGAFFGQDTISAGTVGIIKNSDSELANNIEKTFSENDAFKVKILKNNDEAKELIKKNEIIANITIPEKFGSMIESPKGPIPDPAASNEIIILTDPASTSGSSIVIGVIDKILANATLQMQGAKPLYNIKTESSSSNKITYFDFVLSGLIGLSLMNSAVQGMAILIAKYRDQKIMKRITTTPLPSWKFVFSEVISHLVLNFLQISLLLLIGVFAFNANIYGSIVILYLVSLLGAVLFLSMGFVVAAVSKTTEAAEGMAAAITVPMMFLGGVFFPLDSLPKWLSAVVEFVPLAPLLQMLRTVAIDGASPIADIKNVLIIVAWIIVLLLISVWRFKFSEE